MLNLVFTRKRLYAGAGTETVQFLSQGSHISLDGRPAHEVLREHLASILQAYRQAPGNTGSDAISIAAPADVIENGGLKAIRGVLEQQAAAYEVLHTDILPVAYLFGLRQQPADKAGNWAILESLDDHVTLGYYRTRTGGILEADMRERGREAVLQEERFEGHIIRQFGPAAGNQQILNELLRELTSAGLSLNVKGQSDLALQLLQPSGDHTYRVSQESERVSLEALVTLTQERYDTLLYTNRERIFEKLNEEILIERQIEKLALLGGFLHHPNFRQYLSSRLSGTTEVVAIGGQDTGDIQTIIHGMAVRHQLLLHADSLHAAEVKRRKEEEERKIRISSELKTREEREALLRQIRETCEDEALRDTYEDMFIAQGLRLGVPDVVVRWNIEEALNMAALRREVGHSDVAEVSREISTPASQVADTVASDTTSTPEPEVTLPEVEAVQEESPVEPAVTAPLAEALTPAVQPEPTPEEPVVQPAPVADTPVVKPSVPPVAEPVAEVVAAPVLEPVVAAGVSPAIKTQELAKTTSNGKGDVTVVEKAPAEPKQQRVISLNDMFIIKGALADDEFVTKKVTFHAEQEIRVLRVLPAKIQDNPAKLERFRKLHAKEVAYYGDVSEIGDSREGKFFYRNYIERTTLAEYAKKALWDKKKDLDELGSADLKLILNILKDIRELKVSHANLTADNILVVSRRRWNLQKENEIRFVGFTADDATSAQMIEKAHRALAPLMPAGMYKEFRERFQL
ncbi:MAG: hypothetical protein SF053_20895 [Bacteroidia bacterium]|nr:hypothetical protein [Bacteroidia bacterium]